MIPTQGVGRPWSRSRSGLSWITSDESVTVRTNTSGARVYQYRLALRLSQTVMPRSDSAARSWFEVPNSVQNWRYEAGPDIWMNSHGTRQVAAVHTSAPARDLT